MSVSDAAVIRDTFQQKVELYSARGEVMEARKWAHTETYGGGGGSGYTHQGTGFSSSSVSISSVTTTHDQFFLKCADGTEKAIELLNWGLAIRPGHQVSMVWGIRKGKERGPYVAVRNHTTGETKYSKTAMGELTQSKIVVWLGIILVGWGILNFIVNITSGVSLTLNGVVILLFAGTGAWMIRSQIKRLREFRSAVQTLVSKLSA
jgi:hypothetical protein